MNRTTLQMLCVASFALVAASCSQGNGTNPVGGTSGGGSTGAGGATSPGSTAVSGGTTQPSGGTTTIGPGGSTETGGSPATGGTTSPASTTSAGGSTSPGCTTTAGGTTKTGGTTTAGGTTSVGGTTKTGGTTTAGGTTSAGGTTTAGGSTSAGGGMSINPASVVPTLDGYLWVATCSDGSPVNTDCPDNNAAGQCPNSTATDFNQRGLFVTATIPVKGTAGTQYTINFQARGVLGTECYSGGTTTAGSTTQPTLSANPEVSNTTTWYMGGSPLASKWNTYEIHVSPAVGTNYLNPLDNTQNVYYLNSFPQSPSGWCEKEESFPITISSASFPVKGGGTISLVLHDSNCLTQQNCGGPANQKTCGTPRTIDLSGMTPPTTQASFASMQQPYKQTNGFYPQWILFHVTSVTSP